MGPRSTPTAILDGAGLKAGDTAGLALFIQPDAWIGLQKTDRDLTLVQYNGQLAHKEQIAISESRVWLRAECDFMTQKAHFSYSTDGKSFSQVGPPFTMMGIGVTFQGVRFALFNFNSAGGEGGYADFDSMDVREPDPHGISHPIPYGREIILSLHQHQPALALGTDETSVRALAKGATSFLIVDQGLGRVALSRNGQFVSVGEDGIVALRSGSAGDKETFQWIETFTGELTLMSLQTHRYLRADLTSGDLFADSPGPGSNGQDGVRFDWR